MGKLSHQRAHVHRCIILHENLLELAHRAVVITTSARMDQGLMLYTNWLEISLFVLRSGL